MRRWLTEELAKLFQVEFLLLMNFDFGGTKPWYCLDYETINLDFIIHLVKGETFFDGQNEI